MVIFGVRTRVLQALSKKVAQVTLPTGPQSSNFFILLFGLSPITLQAKVIEYRQRNEVFRLSC